MSWSAGGGQEDSWTGIRVGHARLAKSGLRYIVFCWPPYEEVDGMGNGRKEECTFIE